MNIAYYKLRKYEEKIGKVYKDWTYKDKVNFLTFNDYDKTAASLPPKEMDEVDLKVRELEDLGFRVVYDHEKSTRSFYSIKERIMFHDDTGIVYYIAGVCSSVDRSGILNHSLCVENLFFEVDGKLQRKYSRADKFFLSEFCSSRLVGSIQDKNTVNAIINSCDNKIVICNATSEIAKDLVNNMPYKFMVPWTSDDFDLPILNSDEIFSEDKKEIAKVKLLQLPEDVREKMNIN